MLWHLLCTITAASHAQQYLDHRKTAATGVPHWHDAPPRIGDDLRVLHRSHNFSAAALTAAGGGARLGRTRRNVVSCAVQNPGYATIWYDDAALDAFLDEVTDARIAAAIDDPPAAAVIETFRPAHGPRAAAARPHVRRVVARRRRGLHRSSLRTRDRGVCVRVGGLGRRPPSAPLNWAFACEKGHELPLHAALLAADRIAAFSGDAEACAGERRSVLRGRYYPGPRPDGPGHARRRATSVRGASSNRALREAAGERADAASTWATTTTVKDVTVLPYCYFRSRGCPHLAGADVVFFHHEFDTAWRPAFWHNRHGRM